MSAEAQLTNGQGDAPQLQVKLGAVPAYAGRPAAPGSRADRTFLWQVSSAVVGERAATQRSVVGHSAAAGEVAGNIAASDHAPDGCAERIRE